ncbi:MAG: LON peptidase substrate-binding domain-containing protein [Anaerolineales bacterium]|nr:LON peptidase substrate-binding domain-containing protein [Anaerolineales bacterium]
MFPLNTVFFPGMTLPLHIFEPRYRQMINRCLARSEPFGVVLIRRGMEVGGYAEPYPIGTYGLISRVEQLHDGRMNIEVIGQERFRVLALHHDEAYLTGTVEKFPLVEAHGPTVARCARRLVHWLGRYLKLLSEVANIPFDRQSLPTSPLALAYLAAIIIQAPLGEKQTLLSCPTMDEMLERECTLYRRELSLIRAMLDSGRFQQNSNFSLN